MITAVATVEASFAVLLVRAFLTETTLFNQSFSNKTRNAREQVTDILPPTFFPLSRSFPLTLRNDADLVSAKIKQQKKKTAEKSYLSLIESVNAALGCLPRNCRQTAAIQRRHTTRLIFWSFSVLLDLNFLQRLRGIRKMKHFII